MIHALANAVFLSALVVAGLVVVKSFRDGARP